MKGMIVSQDSTEVHRKYGRSAPTPATDLEVIRVLNEKGNENIVALQNGEGKTQFVAVPVPYWQEQK